MRILTIIIALKTLLISIAMLLRNNYELKNLITA